MLGNEDELKRVNGLNGQRRIVPGFALLVPARGGDVTLEQIPTAMFKEAPAALPRFHKTGRGETIGQIAERYGISVADLKKLNNLSGRPLAMGQRLRLNAASPSGAGRSRHSAKAGRGSAKPAAVKRKHRR